MDNRGFSLWLEFEHWVPNEDDDPEDDFFIMHVELPDGKRYALNVWTFRILERAVSEYQRTGENLNGVYVLPPDLFVQRLDRKLMEDVVADLISTGQLLNSWLITNDITEP